ncbi:hypothetical protein LAZ67_X003338 [Cordylochernes scorpioides]|uniref:Uncharacterized protein n=1 Tax=Cordylochernes scorpioides TaxID=51811 RepID=A0ABY6LUC7_9ARAC|nr:hypothetical protein LAZ67_X003338 [Cordylochernes scorpioides]
MARYCYVLNILIERFNKTLYDILSIYINVKNKSWDEVSPFVKYAFWVNYGRQTEDRREDLEAMGAVIYIFRDGLRIPHHRVKVKTSLQDDDFHIDDIRQQSLSSRRNKKDTKVLGTMFQDFDGILGRSTSDNCKLSVTVPIGKELCNKFEFPNLPHDNIHNFFQQNLAGVNFFKYPELKLFAIGRDCEEIAISAVMRVTAVSAMGLLFAKFGHVSKAKTFQALSVQLHFLN